MLTMRTIPQRLIAIKKTATELIIYPMTIQLFQLFVLWTEVTFKALI
ncbi:hypothetical protein ACFLWC_05820 [Chloroflexota bacterium]